VQVLNSQAERDKTLHSTQMVTLRISTSIKLSLGPRP